MKNNIIFYAEVNKTEEGNELLLHKINLDEGCNLNSVRARNKSFVEFAIIVLNEVDKNKPKQIVVDRFGYSIGLKDSLSELLEKEKDLIMADNGELFYNFDNTKKD